MGENVKITYLRKNKEYETYLKEYGLKEIKTNSIVVKSQSHY